LRVRSDNPCEGIRAPEKSPDKYKTVLRPTECLALVQCEDVPGPWRERYSVLLYTYVRPGEGRVLEWSDVDFTTNKIRIARAWDYEEECTKATKTWATRDVPIEPIEPTLLPLLKAMHKRAGGEGLVLPMLPGQADELSVSKVFRDHLEAAGVDRPDLFAASQTQIRIRLRSLRDIGITWRLWRGDNPFAVQRNAGHKRFATTEKYIGDMEKLSADCGVPFPLIASKFASKESGPMLQATGTFDESGASPGGFEPLGAPVKMAVLA
jgi:integrase